MTVFPATPPIFLVELGYEVEDLGNATYDETDDYPDFIFPVTEKVAEDPENNRGIVLGGSGQGEATVSTHVS